MRRILSIRAFTHVSVILLAFMSSSLFAAGNAPQPSICVRSCWGARAPSGSISQMGSLNRAIVHHSAGAEYNTGGFEDSKADVRGIQNLQMDTNGWSDIGYHFLLDKYGNIFEGRSGSMSTRPRGAHDADNTNSFGWCCMGYYHPSVNNAVTAAMMNKLYDCIAWRMPNGWQPYGTPGSGYGNLGNSVGYVDGHRRVIATACPGDGIFGPYMGTNMNAGTIRAEIQNRINGAPPTINPPYTFASDTQGWTAGNNVTSPVWTNCCSWPGIMYVDQTGGDGFLYSPATNFTGSANQLIHVRLYPQNGTTAPHDVRMLWRTAASTSWDEAKSSTLQSFVRQNDWFDVYLALNGNWTGQNIIQLRLDVDQVSQGNRWIIDTIELVNINQPPYTFDSDAEGWSVGNGLTGFTWTNCCSWTGIVYADQTGPDAFFYAPKAYFAGNSGDWVKVRVYPQNGITTAHEMQIFWSTTEDPYFSSGKSSAVLAFNAQNAFYEGYVQVGNNAAWSGKTILQVRLDFDQVNTETRWIVDSLEITGGPPTPPAAPSGLSGTAANGTQANLTWTDNSNNETNFVVARSTVSGGPYTDIATVGANVTNYTNTGLTPNTTYYYVVRAINGGGASANSAQASVTTLVAPPAAPSGLTATGISTTQINLSWTDNSSDEANFVVGRSAVSGGPYTDIATLPANTTSYSNTGLTVNTTYYYVVRATNIGGSSANSAQSAGLTWPDEIVIDNSSASFTASTNWSTATSSADKFGADYRFRPTAAVTDTANWNVTLPQSRNYEIYAWWAQGSNRSTAAPYILPDNATVAVNQQSGGGAWNSLGIKSLSAGATSVKLNCVATTGFVVIADGVRIVPR